MAWAPHLPFDSPAFPFQESQYHPWHPHPGCACLGKAVTLRALDWHSPAYEAAFQGLAGHGKAGAGRLGWGLQFRVRGEIKGGQLLAFRAGEADPLTGRPAGAWDRTGPLLGGDRS